MVINTNLLGGTKITYLCSFDCTNIADGEVQMPDGTWLPACEDCAKKKLNIPVDNTESN